LLTASRLQQAGAEDGPHAVHPASAASGIDELQSASVIAGVHQVDGRVDLPEGLLDIRGQLKRSGMANVRMLPGLVNGKQCVGV
jgi:hypothetical protein